MTPEQRLEAFRRFVQQSPGDSFARYSLAMGYRSLGRNEEAARELEELRRRDAGYVPAYLMLGQVLEALGRRRQAAQAYEEGMAAASRGGNDHALGELGRALEALGAQEPG